MFLEKKSKLCRSNCHAAEATQKTGRFCNAMKSPKKHFSFVPFNLHYMHFAN